MKKAFSLRLVSFAARSLVVAGIASSLLPGCFTVGDDDSKDEDECEEDSDCDDDEECNRGECERIGGTGGSGTGGSGTGGSGTGGSGTGGGSPGSGGSSGSTSDTLCGDYCSTTSPCGDGTVTVAECTSSCETLRGAGGPCGAAAEGLANCALAYPGNCEAIQTNCLDEVQALYDACGGGECSWTNDGECDEPEGTGVCPEGTDTADCSAGS